MPKQKTSLYDLPLTETELNAPIRSAKLFFRRAKHFLAANNLTGSTLPVIKFPEPPAFPTDDWKEWREYFERHVGQVPVVMRKMIDRSPDAPKEMTVPTQFPVLFDQTFRPDPNWKPAPPRLVTKKEHHETLEAMRHRFGSDWGIKNIPKPAFQDRKRQWHSLTDDELRTLYPARKPSRPVDDGVPF